MKNQHEARPGRRARRVMRADMAQPRPLLASLPLPSRYFLGMGLLFLCLWLPAFATLFRR